MIGSALTIPVAMKVGTNTLAAITGFSATFVAASVCILANNEFHNKRYTPKDTARYFLYGFAGTTLLIAGLGYTLDFPNKTWVENALKDHQAGINQPLPDNGSFDFPYHNNTATASFHVTERGTVQRSQKISLSTGPVINVECTAETTKADVDLNWDSTLFKGVKRSKRFENVSYCLPCTGSTTLHYTIQ